jgi:phenylalanyl-tRNA synthetase alpha chain
MELKSVDISALEADLQRSFAAVSSAQDLELLKRDWLSKDGLLKNLFKQLREIEETKRPDVAAGLNRIKSALDEFVARKEAEYSAASRAASLGSQFVDLSLPGKSCGLGAVHPITLVERRISEILKPFGFKNVVGPEVETEYYCFDALNIQPHHPARDMQDTFYVNTGHLLRTHTTSIQSRELQKGGLPIKIAAYGRAYRNETEDASHQALFHQFELVWLDKGLTLANLMGLINHILKELYGKRRKVKFMPKYYPYTEPSIGPYVDCAICKGSGCSACGRSGWVAVGGSGMIHRKVLEEFKYDPEEVSGFAFGLGTARLAAQFYNIPTLKMVYDGDLRTLRGLV